MDEDEAKSIASDWIRRLEATVLSKVHDNSTPKEGRHHHEQLVTNQFRHDKPRSNHQPSPNEKINTDSTKVTNTSKHTDHDKVSLTRSTLTDLDGNPRRTSNETLTHLSRNSPRTPRIDLEKLRKKRLERFGNNEPDRISIESEKDHRLSGNSVSDSSLTNMLQYETRSDEPALINDNKWTLRSFDYQSSSPRNDEDDKLRLELWGLRGAVESGQLDINAYLRPARSTEFNQNSKQETLHSAGKALRSENGLSYQEDCSKAFSSRDNNYNLTSISSDREYCPIETNSCTNLSHLASMLSIETSSGGGESSDMIDSKEDFTHFSVSKHQAVTPYGCPVPQIEGNLYNGFETSDSESSVNAICHNGKYSAKKTSELDPLTSSKHIKSGRGKQKILNELTEFLDVELSCKQSKKHKEKVHFLHAENQEQPDLTSSAEVKPPYSDAEVVQNFSSPIHMHENGSHRSRSISPENCMYMSRSAPMSNGDNSLTAQVGCDEEELYQFLNEESRVSFQEMPGNVIHGKVCPTCHDINSKAANWCIECGTALIAIEATLLDQGQQTGYQQKCQETRKLIDQALEQRKDEQSSLSALSKKERQLQEDVIKMTKEVEKNAGFRDLSNESLQSSVTSYKRRWLRSSLAWNTFEPNELSKPSSINVNQGKNREMRERVTNKGGLMNGALRSRSSSDLDVIEKYKKKNKTKNGFKSNRRQRTTSATYHSADDYDSINLELANQRSPREPIHIRQSSAKKSKERNSGRSRPSSARHHSKSLSPLLFEEKNDVLLSRKSPGGSVDVPPLNLDDIGSYDRILTLIRSQRDSEPVPYLYLPDEILLEIFCHLSNKDLVSCACVCSQFNRIAMDDTLWKLIVIRKNRNICDSWLDSIGDRHPSSLTISQCSSNKVSSEGLRNLFRKCSESLEEVNFSGCSGGELIGESILLHISVRCFNVVSVDVSWTNVSDNGVQELAKNLKRLECLCLNGCQAITDKSLTSISKRHGESLRIFEVFGCFNITPAGLLLFGSQCIHLQTLNIGQCHKMTDSAVGNLVSHLPEIENLDLRGCKQTRDSAVKKIVRHCPHLKSLVLANCPLITDATLSEISTNLSGIKSLDICGCSYVTDAGVRALARCCNKLELLDLSSTGTAVTSKSIVALSNYCSRSLSVLKLSFCADISVNTVNQVVKNCKKLTLLHLYGCKRIKELDKIKNINQNLVIER